MILPENIVSKFNSLNAERMYFLHSEKLDIEYMRRTAKKDRTLEHFEKMIVS